MIEKKRILITAGGTATAWHMSNVIKNFFEGKIELHICDINPKELVASSNNADYFHQVPMIFDKDYRQEMLALLERENIDIIVPLIDWDLFTFSKDNADLLERNILSTGPLLSTAELLSDKAKMAGFLQENEIYTPKVYGQKDVNPNEEYVIKPATGCGSKGFKVLKGKDLLEDLFVDENMIIQELCDGGKDEITAEVFKSNDEVRIFCRRRIETKEGVCTKMQVAQEPEINDMLKKLVKAIEMPSAFCVQFMKHRGHWNLIDCNLRIGAGTALTTAAGFQLTRAFFANLLGEHIDDEWFKVDEKIKAVVRVYREEVMR